MSSDAQAAVVRSYAKVNLTLDVLGKRPDGYHTIESVMQSISLHDTVTLSVWEGSGIRLTSDMPGIPGGEANLAYRAAALLFERRGVRRRLEIRVEKRIPPEAGLGGGSTNAAAVFRGLNRILEPSMTGDETGDLAAELGSDVSFFLVGGTAFVWGRGEEVEPLPDIPRWWLAIVKPAFGVSTAWAYSRLDEIRAGVGSRQPAVAERRSASQRILQCAKGETDLRSLPNLLSNDLEVPAIEEHPEIGEIKRALLGAGARAVLMCGSGSAVFGLFDSEREASASARVLSRLGEVFVARTITRREAVEIE